MLPRFFASLTTSRSSISSYLGQICHQPSNPYQKYLRHIYDDILSPYGKVHSVRVPFHEHKEMEISDYFSALGYVLTYTTATASFTQLLHRLSQYAEWCRVSSAVLETNTPTVVQMLFQVPSEPDLIANARYGYGPSKLKFSLASSVSAGKGGGREDVRENRIRTLESVWSHPLVYPTPVQQAHASAGIGFERNGSRVEPSAELFGTPWGHCGEGVSFPSMHQSISLGRPLGTLALSVKAMTCVIPGTDTIPVCAIPALTSLTDIVEILKVAGAMRPMCLNCLYLRNTAGGSIQDHAVKFSAFEDTNIG
ncbi:hypothetical protein BT96DRAFT_968273 [Gymnopus androsaceus JB14]|uniref:Uncharacterized protein n=1 Tax=Gymnopus androsaceus JB14 TaxID=1447944 RepID=A0A6A4GNJ3_9AGAR|nr:hypothetical protein BT96DRAFT_968273 [Gymnopus androsaceus JB14]